MPLNFDTKKKNVYDMGDTIFLKEFTYINLFENIVMPFCTLYLNKLAAEHVIEAASENNGNPEHA